MTNVTDVLTSLKGKMSLSKIDTLIYSVIGNDDEKRNSSNLDILRFLWNLFSLRSSHWVQRRNSGRTYLYVRKYAAISMQHIFQKLLWSYVYAERCSTLTISTLNPVTVEKFHEFTREIIKNWNHLVKWNRTKISLSIY